MRRIFAVPLLVVMSLGFARAQGTVRKEADTVEEIKKEILQREDEQNQALLKNDGDLLGSLLADELVWTKETGVLLSKDQMMDDLRSGNEKNSAIKHEDIRLHVYGNTVVVTGLSTSTYLYQGKRFAGGRRFTNVWIKQGGQWLLAVHHVTPIAPQ